MRRRFGGQSIVEFALVAPLFFLLTFGVIEGGRLVFTYHEVQNAAREGARYAVAHGSGGSPSVNTPEPIRTYVPTVTTGLDAARLTVNASWPGDAANSSVCPNGSNDPGCPVVVTVSYQFQPIVAMVFGTGPITLSAQSEMRVHY